MTRVITGILDQCLRVCVYDIGGGVYTNLSIMTRVITGILDQCLRVCVYDIGGCIYELVNHDPCYNWDIRSVSSCLCL